MATIAEIVENLQFFGSRWFAINQKRFIGIPKCEIETVFDLKITWDSAKMLRPLGVVAKNGFNLTEFYDCFVVNRPFFSICDGKWVLLSCFGKENGPLPANLFDLMDERFSPKAKKTAKGARDKNHQKSLESMDFLFPDLF